MRVLLDRAKHEVTLISEDRFEQSLLTNWKNKKKPRITGFARTTRQPTPDSKPTVTKVELNITFE